MVQNNLNTALKRVAQAWYILELNNLECGVLHNDHSDKIEVWMDMLVKKFKKQPGVALTKLMNKKYMIKDA